MGFSSVTFIAQMVNLAILVFLLYKFLFKPLLNAIDQREQTIADEVKKSKLAVEHAEKRLADLNKKHEEIDDMRRMILQQAHRDADDLRVRLEAEAREEADQTRARWQRDLEQERQALEADMRDLIIVHFKNFAQKALEELADTSLEKQMIAVLKKQYALLDEAEKQRLTPADPAVAEAFIATAFDLSDEAKAELKAMTGIENLTFKTNPHIACGVELSVNGQVLSWNLEAYLREFTESLKTALDTMSGRLSSAEK